MTRVRGHWIAGQARVSPAETLNENPSDLDQPVGVYARGGKAEADAAVAAACEAFPTWSRRSPQVRADVLNATAAGLMARKDELAELLASEEGKTLGEALGEVVRAAQIFSFMAGEALRMSGETLPSVREGVDVLIFREPVGCFALITPWNFPIAIPAWKIAPAIAFGNTVVLKPAELAPGSAWALVETLHAAGLPPGVVNLVMGAGREVGEALVEHADVAGVSFTGSVSTGRSIAARCGALGKRVQCEMGGKNPLVVLDDADLDVAVDVALNGAFFSTGQRCTASSRLIVTPGIEPAFVQRLTERMRALKVGHALDRETQIGPVVDAGQFAKDREYIETAAGEGGEVVGGEVLRRPTRGHFLAPALVLGATPQMRVSREEVFGPVASVIPAADYDEALALANDTEFGLSAGICTRSHAAARHFLRNAEAGMVMVNLPTAGVDPHAPFGGRKGSSLGPREQGSYARDFYTVVKTGYVG